MRLGTLELPDLLKHREILFCSRRKVADALAARKAPGSAVRLCTPSELVELITANTELRPDQAHNLLRSSPLLRDDAIDGSDFLRGLQPLYLNRPLPYTVRGAAERMLHGAADIIRACGAMDTAKTALLPSAFF